MNKARVAVFPGSFDPLTCGHYDIALRAAQLFDCVYVVGFYNCDKTDLFSAEERLELLHAAFDGTENVRVAVSDRLLADYVADIGAYTLVKGLRSASDYDYEAMLAEINRRLCPGAETLFLPARAELAYLSSTYVRELLRYGRPLEGAVPESTIPLLEKKRARMTHAPQTTE